MNNYYSFQFKITPCSEDITDLLAAFLADDNFESFEPHIDGITAYIKEELLDTESLSQCIENFPMSVDISYSKELIEGQDWNSEWEKNYFKPILIDQKVSIRSSFHTNAPSADYEILIDPKMAFGTGHHATTTMMVRNLLNNSVKGMIVIDMGTGTGILAILATMLGASDVYGIEIDPMAYENTLENGSLNKSDVKFICGDSSALKGLPEADIFLANINRNVILADIEDYSRHVKAGGLLILSGFYPQDIEIIMEKAAPLGYTINSQLQEGEWTSIILRKVK